MNRVREEHGAVMVIVAVALVPLLLFAGFAIDISHWWDYSRNLQNRADAAALAAGTAFAGSGFATMCGNTQSSNGSLGYALPQRTAGDFAQLFSGPGNNEPWPNVPYGAGSPEPDQTPTPGDTKVFNETTSSAHTYNSYINVPNLTAASLNNYYVLLNAKNYFNKLTGNDLANPDFGMGNICNSDPTLDASDPQCSAQASGQTSGPCAVGPMVDVKVAQEQVPLFFPLLHIHPTITAHARVSLAQEGTGPAKAIAVKNPVATKCADVTLTYDNQGTPQVLGTWRSNSPIIHAVGQPIEFDISVPSITFNGTGAANAVSATVFLNDCSGATPGTGTGDLYDGYSYNAQGNGANNVDPSLGLLRINEFDPSATGPHLGAVTLSNGGCTDPGDTTNQNPYFFDFWASTSCNVNVNATVANLPANNVICAEDIDTAAIQPLTGAKAAPSFTIGRFTGHHSFLVGYSPNNQCKNNLTWLNSQQPVQETYAGFDDDNGQSNGQSTITLEDDSGPIAGVKIVDASTSNVVDSVAKGSMNSLVVKVFVQGLKYSSPQTPPVILRTGAQGSDETGAIDCGEGHGNGPNGIQSAIANGCPMQLTLNTRTPACVPAPNAAGNLATSPWDCVQTIPGARDKLPSFIAQIIDPTQKNNACSANNWPAYAADQIGHPISPSDPRVMTFVVTGAFDLDGNAQPNWIPVLGFADFYVTGWDDTLAGLQCNNNEPYPLPASSTGHGNGTNDPTNEAFWGHWFQDVTFGGGSQNPCVVGSFTNCVPVLTR